MTKYLTEKVLTKAMKRIEEDALEPIIPIGTPLGFEDLDAKEIISVHVADYVEIDTKALIAQGYTKHKLYPNGWVKLIKAGDW